MVVARAVSRKTPIYFIFSSLRAESARAFTGRRNSRRGEDFLSRQQIFFTETALTPERKVKKSFPRSELTVMPRAKNGSSAKIGAIWQKSDIWTKNRNFGSKKKEPLLGIHHVLATTGKSCSKKKRPFAQITKGENVILGDFLG